MAKPHWTDSNFEAHYLKHPAGEDRACWCDLCNIHPGPVDRETYRQASIRATEKPWLTFTARYRKTPEDAPAITQYSVDSNQCLSAIHVTTHRIKTCYHDHPHGEHHVGDNVAAKKAFLQHWIHKKALGTIESPRDVKLNVEPQAHRLLATYAKELTAPVRSRRR